MVIPGHNLVNSQVSVNRTIDPTLVYFSSAAGVPGTGVGSRWLECLTLNTHASPCLTLECQRQSEHQTGWEKGILK